MLPRQVDPVAPAKLENKRPISALLTYNKEPVRRLAALPVQPPHRFVGGLTSCSECRKYKEGKSITRETDDWLEVE